ncbi:hypothetical protein JW777_03995 [bacterium]|nr:hypothetical protein [bacterium]
MKSIAQKSGFILLSLAVFTAVLSCGSQSDKGTGPTDQTDCTDPPAYNLSGTWSMNVTVTGGSQLQAGTQFEVMAVIAQADGGEFTGSTQTEGGLTAELSGKVCGSDIVFTLTQNAPCAGTFRGTGSLQNGFFFTGSYSGKDCNGTLAADVEAMITTPVSLTASAVWSGTTDLYSSVVVPPGMTLTIRPGARVRARTNIAQLVILGNLSAKGTPDSVIVFDFDPVRGASGFWTGVSLRSAESAEMEHCRVRDAMRGINLSGDSGDIRARYCRFEFCRYGVLNNGKPVRLDHLSFVENWYPVPGGAGYYRTGDDAYADTLSDCVFDGNACDAQIMGREGGNSLRIEGSNFMNGVNTLRVDDVYTENSTISVTGSFGLLEMDSTTGTNRIVVTEPLAVPNPAAGCGF